MAAKRKAAGQRADAKAAGKATARKSTARKSTTRKATARKATAAGKTARKASGATAVGQTAGRATGAGKSSGDRQSSSSAKAAGSETSAPKTTRRKRPRKRVDPARLAAILEILVAHDPHPKCALDHANPFELLAATILSAQCTDVRVNMVTPGLFARWPTPAELAAAAQADVEEVVRTTGFFRNKARNLIGMAQGLVERFDGQVPTGMDDLLSLPGVARKTANVVRGECFGLADGVTVDTHVRRLSNRLGLTREDDPVQIERDLMRLLPHEHWITFSHRLIRLGRTLCPARKPRCDECPLAAHCPQLGV